MKKYYVYKTTNTINDKIYIGVHGSKDIENDTYLGSGTNLKPDIKHYGAENFSREILSKFDTREEALKEEKSIVTKEFIESENTYNMCLGGMGPTNVNLQARKKQGKSLSKSFQKPELRERMSESIRKLWQDPEYKKKMKLIHHKRNQNRSEIQRANQSDLMKKMWQDPEYRKKKGAAPATETCQYCGNHYSKYHVKRHERNCNSNPEPNPKVSCQYCNIYFKDHYINKHESICFSRPTITPEA